MRTHIRVAAPLIALFAIVSAAWGQGHDHGKPPEQLGKVSFANSCDPAVQADVRRGVALLHSFWFREGEKAFREVLERDPQCAIATWGIAANVIGNPYAAGPTSERAREAREAIARGRAIGTRTERERLFVEAVAQYYDRFDERSHGQRVKALADAFEKVAKRFPDDDEAQILYAVYLTATQELSDKTFAAALKAAAILEVQFKKHPDHPGAAHYLIHSYDYPRIAEKGLAAARRYAEIAPSAPHALHMPSHIFTRVGAWQESAAANERSAAVAKAESEPGDQLHALDYLAYAYLQMGRDGDARRVLDETRQLHGVNSDMRAAPYTLAAMAGRYAMERGAWQEAARLEPIASRFPFVEAITRFARAVGAARSGDAAAAERDVQELAQVVEALKAGKEGHWVAEGEVQLASAAAWVAFAKGNRPEALTLMRRAADMEEKSENAPVTPGRIVPARELLGDMLLEAGRAGEALVEYERSQVHDPNRYRSLYGAGQAAAQSGNREKARHYFSKLNELAGSGSHRPEIEQARRYLASN
jgi:tetratricopeptide (TPR) repeat protein